MQKGISWKDCVGLYKLPNPNGVLSEDVVKEEVFE